LLEHRGLVDFLSQRNVFLLQPLLSPLAIVDIGTGDVPANDLALVIAHRVVPSEKPAIASIAGLQAHFQFVGQAARQRTLCKRFKPSDIVRMCGGADASLQPLVEADAGILEGRAVRVQPLVLRSVDTDELWRKIKRLAEYRLTFA